MKQKLTGLIILCVFINLFSSFAVNAQESDAIASAAFDNTMDVAKTLFVSYCVSATLDIVLGKIAFQNSVTAPEKNKTKDKAKTVKDFEQVFFVQTVSNYSSSMFDLKPCPDFSSYLAMDGNDIQVTMLLMKFLRQFFVFLILLALFFLLPRGSIDNYAISNINIKMFKARLI
jgi:hypothetical protein